jgi:hypothetical protein
MATNKYLEKIAAKRKKGQLTMRKGQKPIKHPASEKSPMGNKPVKPVKQFMHMKAKIVNKAMVNHKSKK